MTEPVVVNVINQAYIPEIAFFGVPLIIGTVSVAVAALMTERAFKVTPNNYKTALAAKGFVSSDAHWKHCEAIFAQTDAAFPVTSVVIGRRATPVAKVITVTVGGNADGDYSIQIDSNTAYEYAAAGKTATEIRDALLALMAADGWVTAASQGGAAITLTAINVGLDFSVTLASPGDAMTQAVTTPNTGIYDDLDAVKAENFDWFGILETAHSKAAILDAARWASTQPVKFFAETNDTAVKTNAAGNVAAALKAKNYANTSTRYHHTGAELYTAALVGRCLGYDVGRIQWSHRQLVGITAKNYGAEANTVENLELNYVGRYDTIGGGRSLFNYTADGGFIEMEIGRWVSRSRVQSKLLEFLAVNEITAYTTEEGVAAGAAKIREALNELATGGGTGFFRRETIEIYSVAIEDQSDANIAKLKIGGFTWRAKCRVGVNEIEVTGYNSI